MKRPPGEIIKDAIGAGSAVPLQNESTEFELEDVAPKEFYTGCEEGSYINPTTHKCNKIKVCKTGFAYNAEKNMCDKIVCPYGFKADETGKCKEFECDIIDSAKYIFSFATGKCVTNNAKFEKCEAGYAYDSGTCKKLIPEDAKCDDEEYLSRESSSKYSCRKIANLEDYDSWTTDKLVAMSDSATVLNGHFVTDGLALAPFEIVPSTSSSTGVDTEKVANILDDTYAELRDIITAYFESQKQDEEAEKEELSQANPAEKPEKTCPEGKVLNKATNRCRTLVTVTKTTTSITTVTFNPETGETTTVKTCVDGYTLNSETNRCLKNSTKTAAIKTCPTGQFLNPATNRCKNLVTTTTSSTSTTTVTYDPVTGEYITVKTCIDGYELNPDTNRCVKVKNNTGASHSLDIPELGEIENSPKTFIALTAVVSATVVGLVFAIYQFRKDIIKLIRKIFRRRK
ncbi:MAG: hypothetical protein Q4E47_01820 [Candidatus Saccharibacteria bacterium]|nr:hypothetical protein [Candidatus Saccharibacteria bacterium]